jgi:hypothetical protein
MSRITGSFLPIVVGLALISIVVLGSLAPPDDSAPVDVILLDPGGLARPGGPPTSGPDDARGGPPPQAGPGGFLAPWVMGLADANGDGRLTPEEAARAAERFVVDGDRDGSGSIDVGGLASAMNRRKGPPPGFGPGGRHGPGSDGPGPTGPRGTPGRPPGP